MIKLNFLYDREKDALNWVKTVKDTDPDFSFSYEISTALIPDSLKMEIIKIETEEAVAKVTDYFSKNKRQKLKEDFIKYKLISLKKLWQEKGDNLVKKIESVFGNFENDEFNVYLTTLYICDYNFDEKYFYLSLYHSLPQNFSIIAHELSHFLFYRDFEKYCYDNGLNKKQFQDLKESTTVLLNEKEFTDILLIEDTGYRPHKNLREFIVNSWKKNKSLKKVVNESIKSPFFTEHS
jgi:hypothetical protein